MSARIRVTSPMVRGSRGLPVVVARPLRQYIDGLGDSELTTRGGGGGIFSKGLRVSPQSTQPSGRRGGLTYKSGPTVLPPFSLRSMIPALPRLGQNQGQRENLR